jgi:hypothetical protein
VVVENRTALPRAFVAYGWRPADSLEQALGFVAAAPSRQELDEPVIEGAAEAPAGSPAPASPARVTGESDTSVTVAIRARARGQLVLLDTLYPGWRADVDGRDADIRPANAAFRAVEVPAGTHQVRFTYRPTSVYVGAAISLLSLAALGAALLLSRRRDHYSSRRT